MENLILIATLFTLMVVERVPFLRFSRSRLFRPLFVTDIFYFLTGGVALGLLLRAQAIHWVDAAGILPLASFALPFPLVVVFAIVLYDCGAYISHLLLHRFDVLWELHKVHHSSRMLDWLATFRAHALEHALRHLASPVFLILLGFPLKAVGIAGAVHSAWAAFVHANVRLNLSVLELLFITPHLHRLHHASGTSERNLGTIFSLWDRLRGTLVTAVSTLPEPIGVPGEIDTYPQDWFSQFVEPLRRICPQTLSYRSAEK